MAENKLADLSMDFAVEILKLCDVIKGHYSIINQLERCPQASVQFKNWDFSRYNVD